MTKKAAPKLTKREREILNELTELQMENEELTEQLEKVEKQLSAYRKLVKSMVETIAAENDF